ncbi:MAG: SsrA-binding protein SmpB [Erysipelotrichaceae bacterium]|nr:SsrA-binding protein SmpB [Erysipelotrichaceae bacterium]
MKKTVVLNRKAKHDYFILDRFEAGIVLMGTEIKAIRKGSAQLKEAYVEILNNEAYIIDMYIGHYEQGNRFNHEERRPRKLLLHKQQIKNLNSKVKLKGFTIVPLELYLDKGRAKVEIALAKGKALYDKRQTLKEKDAKREIEKNIKNYY